MIGTFCTIEALDINKHAEKLFNALCINTPVESWTYLPYGPFASLAEFKDWLDHSITEKGVQLYAMTANKTQHTFGICGYLAINPEQGSIEVGHLHYTQSLKKNAGYYRSDVFNDGKCVGKIKSIGAMSGNVIL